MNSTACKRIILAGYDGCRVSYCEDCSVAELEIGALSLRLELHAFTNLSDILQQASAKLAAYHEARKAFEQDIGVRHVH